MYNKLYNMDDWLSMLKILPNHRLLWTADRPPRPQSRIVVCRLSRYYSRLWFFEAYLLT
jgi:hypothetical protein